MKWKKTSIESIKSSKKYSLVGGPFGSDLTGKDYVDYGVPVIRGTNLPYDKKFSSEDLVFVSQEKAEKLISNTAYPGDLIFTQRGTLGQVGIVPSGSFGKYIISQSQMKLTVDCSKADPLFVYYYFRTKECIVRIENLAISSGVPHINLRTLKEFQVPSPPLPVQRKIASTLSAYDELIENNNQRVALLEQMAEEIYKEWFVRLRFPGYENTPIVDGVPEGWDKVKLRDCIQHYIGGGWGDEEPNGKNDELPAYVIRGTDIPDFRIGKLNFDVLRYHSASNLSSRRLEENDIVFEVSGGTETQSLGRTAFIQKEALERFGQDVICASFCKLIRVKKDFISPYLVNSLLNRLYSTGE